MAGRIVDGATGRGIPNAVVTVGGSRPVLSESDGFYMVEGVEAGTRTLQVEAFGYRPTTRELEVTRDVMLDVAVDAAAFVLDPLIVAPRAVDVTGRVRDPIRDAPLKNVDIRTSSGQTTRTNARGRFDVTGWEGMGLFLEIRAFGYMPLDTVIEPGDGRPRVYFLRPDPLVEEMIDVEIRRIEDRAGGQRAITMRPLDRTQLLRRWSGHTVEELLRLQYGRRAQRIRCTVIDEESLTAAVAEGVLSTTLAQDVERIEFLFDGAMLRIYTRDFMRTMLGSGIELRPPTYVDVVDPPFCS